MYVERERRDEYIYIFIVLQMVQREIKDDSSRIDHLSEEIRGVFRLKKIHGNGFS